MKANTKTLIKCVAIPLFTGVISGLISRGSMATFGQLNKPPLSPPGWLFPVVWTILYALMGIASYLVFTSTAKPSEITKALKLYILQLVVNFFWSIIFFNFGWYLFSFLWLILLWVLIVLTIRQFYHIEKLAAYLMIPYLIWVTFAGYLNLGIYLLN